MSFAPCVPVGWDVIPLDQVDSTNAEALRRAEAGRWGPEWVWALRQTSGRGRQGRPWSSDTGNLYCSALLSDGLQFAAMTQLCFVAGLAAHDAAAESLADLPSVSNLALKWPNDLLLDGAKLCGILLESTSVRGRLCVAIGIGINVSHHPANGTALYPTTCLREHGSQANVRGVFERLAEAFASRLDMWKRGAGFGDIRTAWMDRAGGLGKTVTVNMQDGSLTGVFTRLDEDGALVICKDDGTEERVLAGDLFLNRAVEHVPSD